MSGRTVLVTGASRGIGRATALAFAKDGDRVAVNYCSSREQALCLVGEIRKIGGEALAVPADVSDGSAVSEMVGRVREQFGEVDILVNNAGIALQKMFADTSPGEWQTVFDVNVTGMYHTIQAVLPGMVHRKSGRIINLTSMWGVTGASCEVAYSASKAAVIGMTKALAKELGPSGITVNCVAPGMINTEMNRQLDTQTIEMLRDETPLGVLGTTGDVAGAVQFLASDQAAFITGEVLNINGGMVI